LVAHVGATSGARMPSLSIRASIRWHSRGLKQMSLPKLLKLPVVRDSLAAGTTNVYDQVKDGLLTPPVKHGRTSCWPEDEILQIQRALIAGKSVEERRQLVRQLVAARSQAAH
jgi:prophage regulatory protein